MTNPPYIADCQIKSVRLGKDQSIIIQGYSGSTPDRIIDHFFIIYSFTEKRWRCRGSLGSNFTVTQIGTFFGLDIAEDGTFVTDADQLMFHLKYCNSKSFDNYIDFP